MNKVTFIGLGVMGGPMAGHLSSKGFEVTVYNRTFSKSESWLSEYQGTISTNVAEAVKDAEVVCICVGNDADLKDVLFGENGVIKSLKKGSLIIDHTTCSATIEKEAAAQSLELGIGYLDAPVSGGGIGAKNGTLSIMVGGSEEDFKRGEPVMESYGKSITLMGEVGSGQQTKMMNQILISATLQGVAEAINFGKKANLDLDKVLNVLSKGAAQSWQLENRGPWMLDEKYKNGGFTVDLIKKDLELVITEARTNRVVVPITEKVDSFFKQLQSQNKGNWDFSSLIELLT